MLGARESLLEKGISNWSFKVEHNKIIWDHKEDRLTMLDRTTVLQLSSNSTMQLPL